MITYLLKPGELTLKGGNRKFFDQILKRNLKALVRGTGAAMDFTDGRIYVKCDEKAAPAVEQALDRLIGISGWARTLPFAKDPESLRKVCAAAGEALGRMKVKTFKIEARRTDKSFPMDSYHIAAAGGDAVTEAAPKLIVDVHNPEMVVRVEIRERGYLYLEGSGAVRGGMPGVWGRGRRGLPVGSAGSGLLLLSGGIDSPVAGYMMGTRGMKIDAVYFHAYPYTSEEARQKVIRLAEIVGSYTMGIRLFTVGFTETQKRIKERSPLAWTTVLLRMAMMECAEILAKRRGHKCLITGESLSQVASQTVENITCTQSRIAMPVLRPLIGLDKEDIMNMAKRLGTYDTSILPYADCCVLFSPKHPILRGAVDEAAGLYEKLEITPLIEEALEKATMVRCGFEPQTPQA
jgi:thiamine biosynthesis protein ThiI